jgi:hypothetical protein
LRYLDYKIIDDKERQTAADELKEDMAANNENENDVGNSEDNDKQLQELIAAKIEVTD